MFRNLAITIAIAGSLASQVVLAEETAPTGNIDGKLNLGLGTAIVYYNMVHESVTGTESSANQTTHNFGAITSLPNLDLVLGGGLTDHYYLGGAFQFTRHQWWGDDVIHMLFVRALADYLFDGRRAERVHVRPFMGLMFEYAYYSQKISYSEVNDSGSHRFGPGLRAGIHSFLTESFSIDLALRAVYLYGSEEADRAMFAVDNDEFSDGFTASIHSLYLGITLGVSGWI